MAGVVDLSGLERKIAALIAARIANNCDFGELTPLEHERACELSAM
jgi:hypothetical protein